VAVKIRLLRMGKIRNPQYRIVVADSRTKRDGRAIEYVGIYHPKEEPSLIEVKSERVQYWLSVGAQPSEAVQRILEKTGDWQQFKGLPAPPPLKVAPEKVSRQATYEAEAKAAAGVADTPAASRPAKKATKAAAAPEVAAARPAETRPVDPATPNREAVAESAQDPAGAGAHPEGATAAGAAQSEGTTDAGAAQSEGTTDAGAGAN
jgi:small subunit ribosomal protein S16